VFFGDGFQGFSVALAEPRALSIQPPLELGCIGNVEAFQQLPSIQIEGIGLAPGVERFFERHRVTPEIFPFQTQTITVPPDESLWT
jgi:hypothetical protein